MTLLDHQIGIAEESTYGTGVTVTKFFEFDSESIEEEEGRTEGDPLRAGSAFLRSDRFTPYFSGASGNLKMAVLTKGFGIWFKHMLGAIATTGPTDAKYTHTATEGDLWGKSLTMQIARPFNPSGTVQPFTYRGGKVTDWTLSNSVDDRLMLDLGLDFMQVDTGTALATASYPTNMDEFTWAGGALTIGGASYDISEIAVKGSNGLKVDRRQIRGNTDKKEPTAGRRSADFSIKADFDSLTQRNRAHATTRAGANAEIVGTWTGPILLGASSYPTLTVTIPVGRFDEWKGSVDGADGIEQELSGVVRFNGSNSPITIAYGSADTTI